jgi:hypothetical protein
MLKSADEDFAAVASSLQQDIIMKKAEAEMRRLKRFAEVAKKKQQKAVVSTY